MIIATGASSNHFAPLKNLLYSLSLFESAARVLVYDLGLSAPELAELVPFGREVRRFRFEDHPSHVDIRHERGHYAWKPIIVADVLDECQSAVLWLDAGNLVHRRLDGVRKVLAEHGFYSPRSAGTVARWTHPGTLARLGAASEIRHKPNRNGAVVGLAFGMREMARLWRACALDPACIAPLGSSRANHRQDQAVLSVLAYQLQPRYGYVLEDRLLGVSVHNDELPFERVRARLCSSI